MNWQRRKLFDQLHYYHAHSWTRGQRLYDTRYRARYRAWRNAWWKLLEKEFPEFIKDGVVTCTYRSTYQPASASITANGAETKGTITSP